MKIKGRIRWWLIDEDDVVIAHGETDNLVTAIGERMYAERGAGISSPPALPTGMKLGSGSTTPAKTGAGAALATYLSNSHQAIDGGFPTSTAPGSGRRVTYQATFAPGKATTVSPITEVVLVNETLTDATSLAAATVARGIISVPSKSAGQSVIVSWEHDFIGA